MKDEGGRMKRPRAMKARATRGRGNAETGRKKKHRRLFAVVVALVSVVTSGCALKAGRGGVPPEVESVVAMVGEDIDEGRYEKIYNEADDQWRHDSTLEQTIAVFSTLKNKLGRTKSRQLHAASEQNTSNGRLAGHSFVLTYETKFERGDAMETFTLVERNGHWLLAKYLVNSTALN
jgi:hypothetical protein